MGRAVHSRRAAATPAAVLLVLFLSAGPAHTGGSGAPKILSVSPALDEGNLVCRVRTEGLPTEKAARSMRGGLPSSVDLVIELVNERDELLIRRRHSFRVAFDLWEEIFRVDDGAKESRFNTLESVRGFLSDMERLAVMPVASIRTGAGGGPFKLRAALVSHAIAPAEKTKIGEWIAGDGGSGTDRNADEREVSLGIGSLIRFVFGGTVEGKGTPAVAGASVWFRVEDLVDAEDS